MPEIIVKLGENIVHKYVFDKEIMSVGRARDNDIVIENLSVSRNHARIRKEGDRFILTDLNSANGTFVNGVRVTRVEIVNDDIVTVGKHKLHFIDKKQSDEEIIGEAFGAERTMLVDRTQVGQLIVSKGKQKDQEFKIAKYETYIGRASDNDVRLHDWFVSKKHAVIIRQGTNFFIKDLGSWRGTMVNGKNVRDCELKDGDEIQLGTTALNFKLEGEGAVPQITGRVPQEIGYDDSEANEAAKRPPVDGEAAAAAAAAMEADLEVKDIFAKEPELVENLEPAGVAARDDDEFSPLSDAELMELEDQDKQLSDSEVVAAGAGQAPADQHGTGGLATEGVESEEAQFAASLRGDEDEMPALVPGLESADADRQEALALAGSDGIPGAVEFLDSPPNYAAPDAARDSYQPLPVREQLPERETGSPAASQAEIDREVEMWLRALKNKSRVIRREAARKLKHLTGRDYDWESRPE